ncbi:TetR/AcrR family transcriptional regulator [Pseudobacillus wudalianchiensis]|uniref:TetR family transcriptional regulator n=1 Tax=Pseudobacillus wudalianchiensis TaxID=1743143 RepID=A0A1B9AG06_9BACI|nr:TetR/AcrR family transcriptional regulator [Bacillus wudalianchiensis]OCA82793.1 TetR family transcriptional regulator [Bacillus wudalianchiensis]
MSPRMKLDVSVILQKAIELIDQHGMEYLSIGSLAKELQVRPPSLYNHISGLDELKQKLAIHGIKALYERMLQEAAGRSGDEAIRALSKTYLQFVRTHPGLYEAATRFPDPEDKELQQAQQAVVNLAVKVLEVYHLKKETAVHLVRGLRSILHGFSSLEQMGGFAMSLNVDESFSLLINTFIEGIHLMAMREKDEIQSEE